ncbi:MAG: hypothetical protein H5U33_15595, partial [Pseudomonas sp.]|nr:hypothetical protein [Pseudomonas sp.]
MVVTTRSSSRLPSAWALPLVDEAAEFAVQLGGEGLQIQQLGREGFAQELR